MSGAGNGNGNVTRSAAHERALEALKEMTADASGISPEEIDVHVTFVEAGVDSLLLIQASQRIRDTFGVEISFRQLLEEVTTIDALAAYIAEHRPPQEDDDESSGQTQTAQTQDAGVNGTPRSNGTGHAAAHLGESPTAPAPEDEGTAGGEGSPVPQSLLERVINQQLQLMSQQLEALRARAHAKPQPREPKNVQPAPLQPPHSDVGPHDATEPAANGAPSTSAPAPTASVVSAAGASRPPSTSSPKADPEVFVAYNPIKTEAAGGLDARQQAYLDAFVERYTRRTAGSKRMAQAYRPFLADAKASLNFRQQWKELVYPIVAARSAGSKIWDVDGNEYVDLTMGYGVNLFGHSPRFITDALASQFESGIHIGPQSDTAGRVAELISELTGLERVGFFNSGTEAVMVALRLARAVTGRGKVALFAGAYHGTFDGVLVRTQSAGGRRRVVPLAPGVPASVAEDVLILDYDTPEALETLKASAHELAAVLVEPVQSRRPDVQPAEFLRELRRITEASGAALIFDEVITGFRVHAGGAQSLFGVRADIATYGKVLGGGMPIGVVAGSARFMDAIDGGAWAFGDASYPRALQTLAVGTFSKHPLAMAGALAVLNELKRRGPALQRELNERTARLAGRLEAFFESNGVPVRVPHCGSLFICRYPRRERSLDLLFHHLIEKGVYVWEGRTCFLSTAHTEEDFEFVFDAVRRSVEEMREGGLLPSTGPANRGEAPGGSAAAEQSLADLAQAVLPPETTPRTASPPSPAARVESGPPDARGAGDVASAQSVPLTEGQREIWLVTRMGEDASRAYNESVALHMRGPLNLSAMRAALQKVVERHEALRITFAPDGESQLIHPATNVELPVWDLTHLQGQEREAQVSSMLAAEAGRTFDLVQGPLFRAAVIRLADDSHLLVLTMHHIITDGWSFGVVLRELRALYAAECLETGCHLPGPLRFGDYARREAARSRRPEADADEAFWAETFSDSVPVLELPTDRPRPPVQTYRGGVQKLTIDGAVRDGLRQLSERQGGTLFMTLLAGFQALLHRLSGQGDIVTGVAAAGQLASKGANLVGYCINMLPLRSRLYGDPAFTKYLACVRGGLLDAYEHQNFSAGRLAKRLNLRRDPSRLPFFNVVFNLDQSQPIQFGDLQVEASLNPNGSSKFDIFFNVTDTPAGLIVDCEYNADLFDQHTIKRWAEYYRTLLAGVVAEPEGRLSDLPLMSEAERFQLLSVWNNTAKTYAAPDTLHALVEEQAARTPDAIALAFEDAQLTYAELNASANRLARRLLKLGVSRGDIVGVCAERSLELVTALLAVLKAGAAYLPLDPTEPRERLALMLEDAGARFVLTQSRLPARLPEDSARVVYIDAESEGLASVRSDNPRGAAGAEDLAYVIYTSGSTGRPKGVMNTHGGICNRLLWMQDAYQLGADDRVLQKTPYTFDVSLWEFFWPLMTGAGLVVARPEGHKDGAYLASLIAERQVTTLHFVPSMLQSFLGEPGLERCANVRRLFCSGEALPFELQERFFARHGAELYNLYGPTEAAVDVTHWRCERGTSRPSVPIGQPIANTRLFVLDAWLRPVPPGVAGELYIGGEGLARGYLGRPELTAERFVPDPFAVDEGGRLYRTGDVARWLAGGQLEFIGRADHQVKVRGFRVEPGEVEAALRSHGSVRDCVVVAREDSSGGKRLVAYVVGAASGGEALTADNLRRHMRGRLPEYMVPSVFVMMGELPLTASGKLDRSALPEPEQERPELSETYVAPRTELEEALCSIWSEVLGVERVGVHDNFFDLGGHSLLATGVISRLRAAFQTELSMRRFFEAPTVAEMSVALVEEMLAQRDGPEASLLLNELEELA